MVKLQQERVKVTVCFRVESDEMEHLRNDFIGNDACIDNARDTKELIKHSDKHLPHSWCRKDEDSICQWNFQGRDDWATLLT